MKKPKRNALIALIIGILGIIAVKLFIDIQCTGWDFFNPVCQAGNLLFMVIKLILYLVFIIVILFSIVNLLFNKELYKYLTYFVIFAVIALIDWMLPDFLPFIDEIILSGTSVYYFIKTIGQLK